MNKDTITTILLSAVVSFVISTLAITHFLEQAVEESYMKQGRQVLDLKDQLELVKREIGVEEYSVIIYRNMIYRR